MFLRIFLLICFVLIGCSKELSEYELLHKSEPKGIYGDTITLNNYKTIEI